MTSTLLSVGLGAAIGLGYYFTVGCSSGSCPITSQWWSSTAYGAAMGYLAKMSWFG